MNTLDKNLEHVIQHFPDLQDSYKEYIEQTQKASCRACTKNRLVSDLIRKLRDNVKLHPDLLKIDDVKQLLYPKPIHVIKDKLKPQAFNRPANAAGVRPTCLDCCRKHISKAIITFQESLNAEYLNHFWLAVGNLSEAEDESISEYPELAHSIRDMRLQMMNNRRYTPDLMFLFDIIDNLQIVKSQ